MTKQMLLMSQGRESFVALKVCADPRRAFQLAGLTGWLNLTELAVLNRLREIDRKEV